MEYKLIKFFSIISAVLFLIIMLQYRFFEKEHQSILKNSTRITQANKIEKPVNYQYSNKSINDYQSIVEKPLFFEDRTPFKEDETAPVALTSKNQKFNWKLIGTSVSQDGKNIALFENNKINQRKPANKIPEATIKKIYENDTIDGKVVLKILDDHVIVKSGNREEPIKIEKGSLQPIRKHKTQAQTQKKLKNTTKKKLKNPSKL